MKKSHLISALISFIAMSSFAKALEPSEPLPIVIDMTASTVEKILTQNKIEHSFDSKTNAYYAIIRIPAANFIAPQESIAYHIVMDANGTVEKITIERGFTGL